MDSMDIQDISIADIEELGFRPSNLFNDGNDFDDTTSQFYRKTKLNELQLFTHKGNSLINDQGDESSFDGENSTFEIDRETGERIFHEVPVTSSSTLSTSSNDKWIEEYLSEIELITSTSISDSLFEDIPLDNDQIDSNWLPKLISVEKSKNQTMFNDQFLSYQTIHDNKNPSEIVYSSPSTNSQDSFVNVLRLSTNKEHFYSNRNRRERKFSSIETDSNTRDSDFTFVQTKLEKFEPDELTIRNISMNRTTRANSQGQQDEDTLRRYNIPLALFEITRSSTEEYNRHLSRLNHLSAEQIHIIKDIRRRGKNKIAAQNCRKRKAISVGSLLEEVDELKRVKHELEERKKLFHKQIAETRNQYEFLHRQVLPDRQLPPAIIVK